MCRHTPGRKRKASYVERSRGRLLPLTAQDRASLRELAARLAPSAAEVKAIACAHSGLLTRGLAPLTEFATEAQTFEV